MATAASDYWYVYMSLRARPKLVLILTLNCA
jgi:hypothetical protein